MKTGNPFSAADLSRRRFVQGLALGGVCVGAGLLNTSRAWALGSQGQSAVLNGTNFVLDVGDMPVNYTGHIRTATTINGSLPGPTLRWKEGSTVRVRVNNHLRVPTSLHWHGIVLPSQMDGVPGLSFDGIAPGESFLYQFTVRQAGTYWYHSHSRFQEQTGLFGALVIEPAKPERMRAERDYVVMLNDWTDENPERILAKLKTRSDYYDTGQLTVADFMRDVRRSGLAAATRMRQMGNAMRMDPTDLSDVSGMTYTYLFNGTTPQGNWTGLFKPGERVRLRFINGSAMTIFDVRIPGLKMTVVAADGQDVEPVSVDEFRIANAEVYDVIVEPQEDRAYTVFAQSIDRSGYTRGTLAPRIGMQADVPAMDTRVWLSMSDMMGGMDGMANAPHPHDAPNKMDMDKMDMSGMAMSGMDMHGMDMHAAPKPPAVDTGAVEPSQTSVGVDMRVMSPRNNLDDPGVGLRNNGRRVLTYADLHTIGGALDPREPGREITLHLTGNMERYMWSFDGVKFSDAAPIRFNRGERLRIVLINDTMMNHPIHLHGMWSELENPQGEFQVRKHTINVQPAQRISYAVSADNPGQWAYHCHMLYHMEAGMFREVVVA